MCPCPCSLVAGGPIACVVRNSRLTRDATTRASARARLDVVVLDPPDAQRPGPRAQQRTRSGRRLVLVARLAGLGSSSFECYKLQEKIEKEKAGGVFEL